MKKATARMDDVRQFSSDKILKHLDRVNEWLQGGNPPPVTVELDMTNVCNHRCKECVAGYFQRRSRDSLKPRLCDSIIRQLCRAGVRGIIFTGGGEPLCHPHTPAAVKLASRLGADVGFITNGELITEDIARVLLKHCVWVRVSLDAATPRTFRLMHGRDERAFRKVLANTKLLVRMKKRLRSRTTVGAGFLTSDYTRNEMHGAALLGRKLGVDYLQFRPMQIHRGGKFIYHWTDVTSQIKKCLAAGTGTYHVLYSKHKYDMMKEKDYGRSYGRCYGHQFATVVSASGKMYLCCHTRDYEKYCIGDFGKNTFLEIWNSRRRRKAAASIDFADCIPLCRDNTFNQVLWNLKQPREHASFL